MQNIQRAENQSGLTQSQVLEIAWIVQICNKKHTYHMNMWSEMLNS